MYCDLPICKQKCVKGTCVGKDECLCLPEYTGKLCDQRKIFQWGNFFIFKALCDSCINGVCIEPNFCECFYGYGGSSCDQGNIICYFSINSQF